MNHAHRYLLAAFLISCAAPAAATTFTVTNTNDSGAGSLRAAIQAVNADFSGPHRIEFNIAGIGVHTIHLFSSLDAINNPVAIDGTTEPGYNPSSAVPLIEIDGTSATIAVLCFAPHSSFRGLILNHFPQSALEVFADACTVQACYVGTNASGTAAASNGIVGVYVSGSDVVIGGRPPYQRNIISGNAVGVSFTNTSARDTLIGNYIGTDVTGSVAIPNTQYGVSTAGATNLLIDSNVISGNTINGIYVSGSIPDPSYAVRILRNLIGTDAGGHNKVPNQQNGVWLSAWYTVVGAAGSGNTISGNNGYGVYVDGASSAKNWIQGNRIGVTADGGLPLGNAQGGIYLNSSQGNVIGYSHEDGSGNLIGCNGGPGISLDGLDATENAIFGNAIGTSFNGAAALGNAGAGIATTSDRDTIGGFGPTGNIIAHNNGGIQIDGVQDPVWANSIFANGPGLGIDLMDPSPGVTLNDTLDTDDGSNHFQNYPTITSVTQFGPQVRLQGYLSSAPSKFYVLQFYANRQCSSSGYGEGESWLGQAGAFTDANGVTLIDALYPLSSPALVGFVFTCTATDENGCTSEFSPCASMATPTDASPMTPVFYLGASVPSPARKSTSLTFTLAHPSQVSLRAYDVSGREVAQLVQGSFDAGPHAVSWNVAQVRAGVYFCRLRAVATDSQAAEEATRSVIVVP
jgi:parallel beta helix pectate lyase-like protein